MFGGVVLLMFLRLVKSDYPDSWLLAVFLCFLVVGQKVSTLASVTSFIESYLT